ncbi:MAG: (2Fe-2S)-binding protein [Pseudomonadota bacterium]
MYICICNGVRERDIQAAVAEGATSFDELQEQLGVSTCCGTCGHDARECFAAAAGGLTPIKSARPLLSNA